MKTRILLFFGIILAVCLWLLLRRAPEQPKIESPQVQAPLTNQPTPTQAIKQVQVVKQSQPPISVPQSTPKTGMELYSQMRSNLLSPERRMRLEQMQEEWRTRIEFYGKVIDENTNPVADAQINFDCNDTSPSGTSYYHAQSDANGLFSINGIQGKLLGVNVGKDGYYSSKKDNGNFYYSGQNQNFVPDSFNPVVFHLIKKGKGESLIKTDFPPGTHIAQLHHDGTPIELDLLKGDQVPAGNGQLKLEFWRDISNKNARTFDWKLQLSANNGGLVPADEEFAFQAPESGYQPSIVINMPATNQNWIGDLRTKYYIHLPDGKYGRIDFYLLSYNGVFTVQSVINPSGSRNLEPAPVKY